MTTLTIRKIPAPVAKAIRKRASSNHYSLNKAAVSILEEAVNGKPEKKPVVYHDLDWFCGSLDKKQAETMRKSLASIRKIDPELWK
jgi:plasmid stability protein